MVGFCDLGGTGIAPVSTKTAVKRKGRVEYVPLSVNWIKIFSPAGFKIR